MGEKVRCISDAVLHNDNFIDLPSSSKALYVYINQATDDRGFCDEVKTIMRMLGAKPKDLQILIDREYLIKVKDWLYLEVHFKINNKNLREDRLKESRFEEYLKDFEIVGADKNGKGGMYVLRQNVVKPRQNDAECRPNITKDNITEDNINKERYKKEIESTDDLKKFLRGQTW